MDDMSYVMNSYLPVKGQQCGYETNVCSLWWWIKDREVVEGTLWVWRGRSAVESCKRCRSDSSVYYKVQ